MENEERGGRIDSGFKGGDFEQDRLYTTQSRVEKTLNMINWKSVLACAILFWCSAQAWSLLPEVQCYEGLVCDVNDFCMADLTSAEVPCVQGIVFYNILIRDVIYRNFGVIL